MGVELWIGEEFEHSHEAEALAVFLKNMVKTYSADPNRFRILANFRLNYSPIDLAVVKNNGMAVIELKQVGGPVFGGENGDWIIRKDHRETILRGGSKGNPYNQVIAYRISFLKFLESRREKFLQQRSGLEPRLDQVRGIVALAPKIPEGSEIDLPDVRWLRTVGLNDLHHAVFVARSQGLALTSKEMSSLLDNVLRLRREDIGKYIESPAQTRTLQKQAPLAKREKPVPIVQPTVTVQQTEIPPICLASVAEATLTINQANLSGLVKTILDPNESVKFVNVPLDNTQGPRTNLKEGQVVCDILKGLLMGGFFLREKASIAIICPRKAQVELVRRRLESLFKENPLSEREIEKSLLDSVSTVDRFQGSQSDMVILSLGMSDGKVSDHLTDEKRLNVAMSRARHKLILLGNRDTLAQEPVFHNLFTTMDAVLPYSSWCVEVDGSGPAF